MQASRAQDGFLGCAGRAAAGRCTEIWRIGRAEQRGLQLAVVFLSLRP
jgi:hypothetical protein